jgi:small GTP-binding protein
MDKQELLEIIQDAAKTQQTELDLSRRDIKELPAEIWQLKNLTVLNLSNNQLISLPAEIGQLAKLTELNLYSNQLISLPAEIGQLAKLTELNLYGNQLTSVPDWLGQLSNLQKINLSFNQLTLVPDSLGQLSNLQVLELTGNRLTSVPDSLGQLRNLQYLWLSGNQLTSVPDWLGQLTNLTGLYLYGNQLTSVPKELWQLTNLTNLFLDRNQLTSVPAEIGQLTNLEVLSLHHNQLTSVPAEIGQLRNLQELNLSNNRLTSLPKRLLELDIEIKWEWKELNLGIQEGIFLSDNPWERPPVEIIKKGKKAIKAWFEALEEEGGKRLNEVKVLLVGYGGAGKTSLVRKLTMGKFKKDEPKTHGVKRTDWKIKADGEDITVHFWDYGGQGIMQATHRVFFSHRSLYILVIDARQESDTEEWLKNIESIGGESPVMVVINKTDEHPFGLNETGLEKKYPNIKGFYNVSCKTGDGIKPLKENLIEQVGQIEMRRMDWPRHWASVKERLGKMRKDYIAYSGYEKICEEEGVVQEDKQKELIGVLHELGVMLHFPDRSLPDMEVLNPEWATEGIYKIINSKELKNCKGMLPGDRLEYVLNKERLEDGNEKSKKYSKDEQRYIVELMKKFELCFELGDDTILVPDLLTEQEPPEGLPKESNLRFYFEYDFMPAVVMPRFMVRKQADLDYGLCWRTGAFLKSEEFDSKAVVRQDKDSRRIKVEVTGTEARGYLSAIRDVITGINKSFKKLTCEEWVPLPDEPEYAIKYKDLIGHEIAGLGEKFVGELGKRYSVSKLLGNIESREETEERKEVMVQTYMDLRKATIGGIYMNNARDDRTNIRGDVIASAIGNGASVTAGDITVIKRNIDNSSGLDDETKAKLKQACEALEKNKLPQEEHKEILEDLEKMRIELMKPEEERQQRRERIKHLFDRINVVAQPVSAILQTITSVAQMIR